ncbi:hypothetical protein BCS71_25105 (plasmid) [Vibrio lentus]|uniref:hypothetical protein n=1 Tax=Vibrio lentus TaxID=136468 RepID=UPI000C83629D|nr:hypothetical protein [Vibrio lentus]PMI60654.1 hypothetical protein BCU41_01910 [Vibrio lentus]
MKLFFTFVLAVFSSLAFASVAPLTAEEAGLLLGAIKWVAGEYYAIVMLSLLALGFIWAQVRQFIKPETLAKAPDWLISILESIAANRGHAKNELDKNPIHFKRMQ